jgi:RNA polymerase sigma-70 factor (ECF subfamily)
MSNQTEPLSPEYIAAMYVAHGEELRRFLTGVLRDPAAAADCLQITFAKLMERGQETQLESRRAWLFKVAFQEAMLYRRKLATTDRVLRKAAWASEVTTRGETADAKLFRSETVERVRRALDQLPAEQRRVVRMRIYEDKTFAVIAEELQIPLGTALGRMRTALQKLREALGSDNA